MIKIGDFSKLSRISIQMLRHYDEIGLLIPKSIENFSGYRYYAEDQLLLAGRITALKNMGFSLNAIGEILKNYKDRQDLAKFLAVKYDEVQTEAEEISHRLLLLETTIKRLGKDGVVMDYDVILKELPERYVASVRKNIASYEEEGMLWEILMKETAPFKILNGDPSYTIAIFHDGEHKESNVDVEVQKTVKGNYKDTENVVFKTESAVLIASAIYKGNYEKVDEVNRAVANWVKDNEYDFAGLAFNIYHISPYETKNPEEYVTEVCYPVKKK